MIPILKAAINDFADIFAERPAAWSLAPGRVEILGNHVDYNDGMVIAAAIDRRIAIAGRPVPGTKARVYSRTFNAGDAFDVESPTKNPIHPWIDYVAGVVREWREAGGNVGGFEAVITGDVPLGAGLSSSAALETATAHFLHRLYPAGKGETPDRVATALLCQRAENRFVGVNCGILDQFSSEMGKEGQLIVIDCRDLALSRHVPLGDKAALVIANTMARHALVDGGYNRLREDCHAAARHFAEKLAPRPITHLRDVSPGDWEKHRAGLSDIVAKRARHVVTEIQRVRDGIAALERGDLAAFGRLLTASHMSSRDDFGNSCAELDRMVALADGCPGHFGTRLSGGGFGGCTVSVVAAGEAGRFAEALAGRYEAATGVRPEMHLCHPADGATSGTLA